MDEVYSTPCGGPDPTAAVSLSSTLELLVEQLASLLGVLEGEVASLQVWWLWGKGGRFHTLCIHTSYSLYITAVNPHQGVP